MEIRIIKHSEASAEQLTQIATIKKEQWNYPIESQLRWMTENLLLSDAHLLMIDNSLPVGYITLSDVEVNEKHFIGIGSVCVANPIKGLGFGKYMMLKANEYISCVKRNGVLLCHEHMLPFYEKCGWHDYVGKKLVCGKDFEHHIMFYQSVDMPIVNISRNF